jgi:TolB-like protein/DNA-binding winged helix-turn-helix (wHTH) protein/Flp pilus assembly protein TadD
MSRSNQRVYEFGPFRLEAEKRVLLRRGEAVALAPKAFDMLLVMVEHHGQVLDKKRLMEMLWPDSEVEEANLPLNMSALRKALGETPNERKYIVTVPGRGYKFAADVREMNGGGEAVVVERYARATVIVEEQEENQEPFTGREDELLTPSDPRASRWRAQVRAMALLGLVFVAAGTLLFWFFPKAKVPPARTAIRSFAVLPFKLLTAESDDEYLGLGMTDTLITKLSSLKEVVVRPTSSILKYSNQTKEPMEVGRELGVESILEGSIQKVGERVRVTVRLVNVEDGSSLWAAKFDEKLTGILALQDSISERVAESLVMKLTGEQKAAVTKRYTDNVEAYQLYAKGMHFLSKRRRDAIEKGMGFFQEAIGKDANYALAYAGLASAHITLAITSDIPPQEELAKAKEAATKAQEIDDALVEAHVALSGIHFWGWDWAGAEREGKRALELNPNYSWAHLRYAHTLSNLGRHEEALAEARRAVELDPSDVSMNTFMGQFLYQARQYDQAVEQLRKALELDATNWVARLNLGMTYVQKGMYQEAVTEFQQAREFSDSGSVTTNVMGHVYALSGKRDEARKLLAGLQEKARRRYVSPCHIATIYVGLGEKEQALAYLEKAYEGGDIRLTFLKVDPRLDTLRADPRFQDLLRRVGF